MHRSDEVIKTYSAEPRVINECAFHGYTGIGSRKPPSYGCKICNEITFFTIVARRSSKGINLEALDELEAKIHAIVELAEEGLFDFKVEAPKFEIEKDAA